MEEKQIRRVPVTDEQERVIGMVSLGDISKSTPGTGAVQVWQAGAAPHASYRHARRLPPPRTLLRIG